jgi:hypothetical protein
MPDYRRASPIFARQPGKSGGWINHLVDPATEQPFRAFEDLSQFQELGGAVVAPDGERLATWKREKSSWKLLLWDIRPLTDEMRRRGEAKDEGPKAAWEALGGESTGLAHCAMRALAAAPDRGVALLRDRLRPAAGEAVDDKKIRQWIKELDDNAFEVRERATAALGRLGPYLRPTLKKARAATDSLEAKRRLDELLGAMDVPPTSDELRELRAVDVLEQIGTKEARKLLRELAGGAAQALLTRAATRALKRLERPRSDS